MQPTSSYITPTGQRAANVDARRVGNVHAGIEQRVGPRALVQSLDHGQIALAVHAQRLDDIACLRRLDRDPFLDREPDDIGQVVLATGVTVPDLCQPADEGRGGCRHDARVDLAHARCASVASFCSTIAVTLPASSRMMRP